MVLLVEGFSPRRSRNPTLKFRNLENLEILNGFSPKSRWSEHAVAAFEYQRNCFHGSLPLQMFLERFTLRRLRNPTLNLQIFKISKTLNCFSPKSSWYGLAVAGFRHHTNCFHGSLALEMVLEGFPFRPARDLCFNLKILPNYMFLKPFPPNIEAKCGRGCIFLVPREVFS